MDPVTILSVAAAAAQFAELSFKITKRIAKYAARSIELPPEIVTINHRLKALQGCVSNIESRLRNAERDSSIDQGRLDDLSGFIKDLAKRCGDLNSLLEEYLPDENDTRVERITKGFQSLSKDSDIKALSESMAPDSVILMLSLVTLDSAAPELKPAQPAATQVITLVPTDRRVHDPVVRQEVIEQINHAFAASDDDEPRVAVLQGMGGQGKTQLAFEYCRQSKRNARFNGIFWVDAADESLAGKTFAEIARKLTTDEVLADENSRVTFVKETLESWTVPWLLIFDNYDDPKTYAIQKFFPASALGHVLITSRSQDLAPLGQVIEIQGMTSEESLRLLFSHCRIERTDATEEHATAIVERLGHLPLAIAQAGAFLGEVRDTLKIDEFLEVYETKMKEILSTTPEVWLYIEQGRSPMQQDQVKNVFTTWEFSMQLLDRGQRAEEKMAFLSALSFFDISDISELLFELYDQQLTGSRPSWLALFEENGLWSTRRYAEVMTELKKLSLISSNVRNDLDGKVHVSLHPLVRDWIMLRSERDSDVVSGFTAAASVLGHALFSFRRSEDIMGDVYFDIDAALERELTSHVMKWVKDHPKNLSLDTFEIIGTDAQLTPITLPWVLNEYSYTYLHGPMTRSTARWAWNHCISTKPPWPAIRCLAGIDLATSSYGDIGDIPGSSPEKLEIVREAVEIATEHQIDSIRDFALSTLATLLAKTRGAREISESREILQSLLAGASSCTRKCLYSVHLADLLRDTEEPAAENAAEDLLLAMFDESERSEVGGPEHRSSHWPNTVWDELLSNADFLGFTRLEQLPLEKLAREYCRKLESSQSGRLHTEYGHFKGKNRLGRILIQRGKHEEAVEEFGQIISVLSEHNINRDMYLLLLRNHAMEGLADAYFKLGRPKDSVCVLLKVLRSYTTPDFHPNVLDIVRFDIKTVARSLAEHYKEMDDREGVSFAVHHYFEAFDDHSAEQLYGVALELIKVHQLGAWGNGLKGELYENTQSTVDEVCRHLDGAMDAVAVLEHNQMSSPDATKISERWVNHSWAQARFEIANSTERLEGLTGLAFVPTTFELHIMKATHLARHGFSYRAIESLQASKSSLASYSSLAPQRVGNYLDEVWAMLSLLDPSFDEASSVTQETIAWTCQQARVFAGNQTNIKDLVRSGILAGGEKLLDHLPVGEPYTENLREEHLARLAASRLPPTTPVIASPRRSVRATVKGLFRRSQGSR